MHQKSLALISIILVAVGVLVLGAAAWLYTGHARIADGHADTPPRLNTTSTGSEAHTPQGSPAETSTQLIRLSGLNIKLNAIRVGDKYGSLVVASVAAPDQEQPLGANNATITFDGELTLSGSYDITPAAFSPYLRIYLDQESSMRIPVIDPYYGPQDAEYRFNNDDVALDAFESRFYNRTDPLYGKADEATGTVSIIVKTLTESFTEDRTFYSFDLVSIIGG